MSDQVMGFQPTVSAEEWSRQTVAKLEGKVETLESDLGVAKALIDKLETAIQKLTARVGKLEGKRGNSNRGKGEAAPGNKRERTK